MLTRALGFAISFYLLEYSPAACHFPLPRRKTSPRCPPVSPVSFTQRWPCGRVWGGPDHCPGPPHECPALVPTSSPALHELYLNIDSHERFGDGGREGRPAVATGFACQAGDGQAGSHKAAERSRAAWRLTNGQCLVSQHLPVTSPSGPRCIGSDVAVG